MRPLEKGACELSANAEGTWIATSMRDRNLVLSPSYICTEKERRWAKIPSPLMLLQDKIGWSLTLENPISKLIKENATKEIACALEIKRDRDQCTTFELLLIPKFNTE